MYVKVNEVLSYENASDLRLPMTGSMTMSFQYVRSLPRGKAIDSFDGWITRGWG